MDAAFAEFDSQEVGRLLATFIDDLSNWYVRRSRRRFWDGESDALSTLYTCIKVLTQLLSPMIPFLTEHVWQILIRAGQPHELESVHLSSFPVADPLLIDTQLSSSVALSRRLVELGRAARAESKIKIRQPLSRALVAANGWALMDSEIRDHIKDELNVQRIDLLSGEGQDLVHFSVKANFRAIGARYGADVQAIASTISQLEPAELVAKTRSQGYYSLDYFVGDTEKNARLELDDLIITETPISGWSVASHSGESVALDLALTPELISAGLAREVIRTIQEERKTSGFDISDRIHLYWNATEDIAKAITTYQDQISDEVLALSVTHDPMLAIETSQSSDSQSDQFGLAIRLEKAH